MAQTALYFDASFTPAFDHLVACAIEIAEEFGDERAMEWARDVLERDLELFCRVTVRRRPHLRLVQDGIDVV